jgi:4-hydroxy-3-methylbut-2-enyl diphosphate reductase
VSARAPEAGNRLLIVAPLRSEARALRRGAPGVRVVRTGMGSERSRRAVPRLRSDPAERVVVAGFCGALEATLVPGQVVVASELRGRARQLLEVPPGLVEALEREGLDVRVAPLASVPRVVRGGDRLALRASGAQAVDMESVWLAACAVGRPFAVVRVVLDGPRHELLRPAFARNLSRAARSLRSVAHALDLWVESQASQKPAAGTRATATGEA